MRRQDLKTMNLKDFIEKYPHLKTELGLRCEYKLLKGVKNLDYLIKRLQRIIASNKLLIKYHSL